MQWLVPQGPVHDTSEHQQHLRAFAQVQAVQQVRDQEGA